MLGVPDEVLIAALDIVQRTDGGALTQRMVIDIDIQEKRQVGLFEALFLGPIRVLQTLAAAEQAASQ